MKSSTHVKENPAALRRKRVMSHAFAARSLCAARHAIERWHFAKEIGQDILAAAAKPIAGSRISQGSLAIRYERESCHHMMRACLRPGVRPRREHSGSLSIAG
jgi:hypothetical protein